jgi:hypothetical protein
MTKAKKMNRLSFAWRLSPGLAMERQTMVVHGKR